MISEDQEKEIFQFMSANEHLDDYTYNKSGCPLIMTFTQIIGA